MKLAVQCCQISSDGGLPAARELDDVLGLSAMAGDVLVDVRTGKNGRPAPVGLLRQSVFGRLAGYEDANGADRLRHDPARRWIVGGKADLCCCGGGVPDGTFRDTMVDGGEEPFGSR